MSYVNSDNRTRDLLIELKRHLRSCRSCAAAVRVSDRDMLCKHSVGLILTIATQYDSVIARRITARRKGPHVVFACPDLSKHGQAYSLTAEPLQVTGIQESLF